MVSSNKIVSFGFGEGLSDIVIVSFRLKWALLSTAFGFLFIPAYRVLVNDALTTREENYSADANPISRPAHGLQGFLVEIVFINPLDLMTNSGTHSDTMHDHQTRQFFPVNQNDALWTSRHIVLGGAREA